MARIDFREKFKDKLSMISSDGSILVNPDLSIQKPKETQTHQSVIKSSANLILKTNPIFYNSVPETNNSFYNSSNEAYTEPVKSKNFDQNSEKYPKRTNNQSAEPLRLKSKSSFDSIPIKNNTPLVQYKPYTLKDYYNIKPKSYYQLGGLGPSNIGSEDWAKKKELSNKRWKYGKDIYFYNAANLPLLPYGPAKAKETTENSRKRALDFAKNIPRPSVKSNIFSRY